MIHLQSERIKSKKGKVTVKLLCGAKPDTEKGELWSQNQQRVDCPKCQVKIAGKLPVGSILP